MNKSNFRFLGMATLGLCVSLMPLGCDGDDDDDDSNTAGTNAGGNGGTSNGGKSSGGQNNGGTTDGGAGDNSSGDAGDDGGGTGGLGGVGGVGAAGGEGGAGGAAQVLKARLRVVHASPNAPKVDVYPHGSTTPAVTGMDYGTASDFVEVDAGTLSFDLRAAGASATSTPAFTSDDIDLEADADYTLVAAGDFASTASADTSFRLLPLQHDFEAPTGNAALARIVHATTAWEDVDLDLVATTGVDVPGLSRFGSESNVSLPSGVSIPIEFKTQADGTVSQLLLPNLTAGRELVVVATGNPGLPFRSPANGFALLVVDEAGNVSWVKERPWLHLAHASDIGGVDVYESTRTAAADRLVDGLSAENMAAFQLPASAAGFTLKAVASDSASGVATGLATGNTSTLQAGEHYLSYIAGTDIRTIHEQFDLEQPSKVMLRGVHASNGITQTVDFGLVSSGMLGSPLISSVMPGGSSAEAGVAVNPGAVTIGAAAHSSTTVLAQKMLSGGDALTAGERAFVLLVGSDQVWAIDTSRAAWTLR